MSEAQAPLGMSWSYTGGVWAPIESLLGEYDEFRDGLAAAGFSRYAEWTFGLEDLMRVEVHRAEGHHEHPFDFLVSLDSYAYGYEIYAADLPNLIALLNEVGPVIKAAIETYEAQIREEQRIQEERAQYRGI